VSEVSEIANGIPVIVHEGRYRIYQKPDGGMHLVYKRDDKETEEHMEIPGAMLRLAKAASEQNLSFPQFVREAMKLRHELYWARVTWP
jgi:hypothetical protein